MDFNEITRIVNTYSEMLFKVAYCVLHSSADAEDIVQEVFIKLIDRADKFNDPEHEKAWLIRVTVNMAKNKRKKLARQGIPLDECCEIQVLTKDKDLLNAVLSLDEKYSTVIHLHYYEGYSISEIGHILSIPAATVGTRLARARLSLRKKLEGDFVNG
ncbi:MAG: RNA polymerase sigma factor [Ruminococcus sp.]|nr:RNA polymerase sigma factor [Ruminococcus sp.]